MKRISFVFTLLVFFFTGFATLQAQGTLSAANPSYSGMPIIAAYKLNFKGALDQGNVQMAQAHRTKLVSFMERDIQTQEAANTAATTTKTSKSGDAKAKTAATNLLRQKAILSELKTLDLSDANAVEAAKSKYALVEEYETLFNARTPATN